MIFKTLKNFLPIPNKTHPNKFVRAFSYIDIFGIFEKDPFGNWMLLKRFIIFLAGYPTYWRLAVANKLKVEGTEYLADLPNQNVFFISNHK